MKVKYLGISDPLELLNGKVYDVISIEGDWYRIVDETGEDYLYPPQVFKVVERNNGSVPTITLEESMHSSKNTAPFAPKPLQFESISLRGRFAYAALCIEARLLALCPDTNWMPLSQTIWEFSDGLTPWDTWIDHIADILPSTFEECPNFDSYRLAGYGLDESEYAILSTLASKLDSDGKEMLEDFFEMAQVCEGTNARHAIEASESCFTSICIRLSECEVDFPKVDEVAFLPDTERDGYGRPFNGTMVSHVLEPQNYGPFDFPNHCIKCGGEVTVIRESIYITATCDDCGEIAMTPFTDPIDEDPTSYTLLAAKTDKASPEALRTLGKITGLNYLQLKNQLESGGLVVCEGSARSVMQRASLLQDSGIAFSVSPEFPYPIPYEENGN